MIHLIANSRVPLHAILSQGLGHGVQVVFWGSTLQRLAVKTQAILVVDLLDGGPRIEGSALLPLTSRVNVWLVAGPSPVPSEWLELALQPSVHVTRCARESVTRGLDHLVAALERELRGPTANELALLVLAREPSFVGADVLVRAVLEHPWEVRHPTQLAFRTGQSLSRLRETCHRLGFRRVEHFIVAVRVVAAEELMTRDRLQPHDARRLVGIADLSNFRRQLRHAQLGSSAVCGKLASPVA